ncbi:uncharacterized protein At1g76660 isoform X2 [Brachypodium distachyon]|uniref:Hydroxyproline-rich glycoprotein family protein n=1 Tax=Brachypodium distachyon TaxID=15368 RepID=I1H716_BRADI|nr:uncharacterized protein At1g76660 isoform X2 [Brachypodium distachyon]KQK22368.1 hypothetical protein BRADI_1g66850v3 [Brachypodium distachyon]KQK22370.1 hypothetical protein BRADI_1g66850v3 [Brachypodium distachyon]|eukprot:XP_010228811.1 uncharacterized protein At1g76660 isoform X2 [Brachypodium distachyon]
MATPGSSTGGGGSSTRAANGAVAISAAATAAGSADARFHSQPPHQDRSRWAGCFSGLSCFGSQKGGKRIVPAARMPDGNASTNRGNALQSGGNSNQNGALNLSLLAPPSSPASFSNSALPSTAQSPNCFLSISANSPGGPTSNMFAVGPYANEPQLVSPPTAFSTYTTEPSTAPLTPPPELAHATTPSSPDVPYARFLSSSMGLKTAGKEHNMHYLSTAYSGGSGLQGSYPLYPGSPSSSLISPASATPRTGLSSPIPEQDVPTAHWKISRSACDTPYSIASPIPEQEVPTAQWKTSRSACDTPYSRTSPSNIFGLDSAAPRNCLLDSNFFRPAASAQFYLDQAQQTFPYNGGRLSVSRDKQDADEVEAYRASFGFSADEIVTTQHYAEIPDTLDDGFSISPFGNSAPAAEVSPFNDLPNEAQKVDKSLLNAKAITSPKKSADQLSSGTPQKVLHLDIFKGTKGGHLSDDDGIAKDCHPFRKSRDEISLKPIEVRKKSPPGQACSDAEIEYRRARSLREANSVLSWRSTLARQLQ